MNVVQVWAPDQDSWDWIGYSLITSESETYRAPDTGTTLDSMSKVPGVVKTKASFHEVLLATLGWMDHQHVKSPDQKLGKSLNFCIKLLYVFSLTTPASFHSPKAFLLGMQMVVCLTVLQCD